MNIQQQTVKYIQGLALVIMLMMTSLALSQNPKTYTYALVDGQELKLDVYMPSSASDYELPRAALVWMHGGGFAVGSRDNDPDKRFMEEVIKHNMVGISFSYRLLRKDQKTGFGCDCPASVKEEVFREAALDFWRAIDYITQHSDDWNIDPSKLIVGGSSAGAEGVLNAVYIRDWVFQNGVPDEFKTVSQTKFAGVLSLAGAVVDARYMTEQNSPPGLFYHGVKDNLVPYGTAPHHYCTASQPGYIFLDGAETVSQKLNDYQVQNILMSYPEGKHEISGVPFEHIDELFYWMDQLFLKKVQIQAVMTKN